MELEDALSLLIYTISFLLYNHSVMTMLYAVLQRTGKVAFWKDTLLLTVGNFLYFTLLNYMGHGLLNNWLLFCLFFLRRGVCSVPGTHPGNGIFDHASQPMYIE